MWVERFYSADTLRGMEQEEFPISTGWKIFFGILGVVALPIFGLGLLVFYLLIKGRVLIDAEGITVVWLGTKRFAWDEVGSVNPAPASGMIGAAMNPHYITHAVTGKKATLPLGTFTNSGRIMQLIQERSRG